jgi:hypothetical protein
MDYKIITLPTDGLVGTDFDRAAEKMAALVRQETASGWTPLGGVAVGQTRTLATAYLFQALTKA